MASPFMVITGVACALSKLAETCGDNHDYGGEAILRALNRQLVDFTEPMEWVEDLADAKDDERREHSVKCLTEWAEEWRKRP